MGSQTTDQALTRRELVRSASLGGAGGMLSPLLPMTHAAGQAAPTVRVRVNWQAVVRMSRSEATLQVVADPLLRRGSRIHDRAFANLRALGADQVRYAAWYPYPRLGVAELAAPTRFGTSWDFRIIDPLVVDFMKATEGHPRTINFCTTPAWMWKTARPVVVPGGPNDLDLFYTQGGELAVPVSKLGDYYRRLASWYTRGGFTDELGRRHNSRHHFSIDCWEVLNETHPPYGEHALSPERYNEIYDEIVAQVAKVSPRTKFVGPALSGLSAYTIDFVSHFLNPAKHRPGTPVDWISYHFYAIPKADTMNGWQASFEQADTFFKWVDQAEAIRTRLSPRTRTTVNEAGTILPTDSFQPAPEPIPAAYWNYSAAMYAYVFANLALRGIDAVGQSGLLGHPGLFPSVSMLDWNTGRPNARYRALQLLRKHVHPRTSLCRTGTSSPYFYGLGFRTPGRERKLLLVNKCNTSLRVGLAGLGGAQIEVVDQRSAGRPARIERLTRDEYLLSGYAVAVATMQRR